MCIKWPQHFALNTFLRFECCCVLSNPMRAVQQSCRERTLSSTARDFLLQNLICLTHVIVCVYYHNSAIKNYDWCYLDHNKGNGEQIQYIRYISKEYYRNGRNTGSYFLRKYLVYSWANHYKTLVFRFGPLAPFPIDSWLSKRHSKPKIMGTIFIYIFIYMIRSLFHIKIKNNKKSWDGIVS